MKGLEKALVLSFYRAISFVHVGNEVELIVL